MKKTAVFNISVLSATLLLVPALPTVAENFRTLDVAAVVDANGQLEVHRWEVPSNTSDAFLDKLDALDSVVASGVEGHRRIFSSSNLVAADPRRSEQWGLFRLDVDKVRAIGTGKGIIVAVVDTGVQGDHPEFGNRVLPGVDIVSPGGDGRIDPNGHGTHVAGIIAAGLNGSGIEGLAPDVQILPVRVLGSDGVGDDANVALGILWAVRHGAQVINLSLGGDELDPLLEDAVMQAHQAGVIVVAAAGNSGIGSPIMFPAAHESVIAVASTGPDDRVSLFSSRGGYVDVAAPGAMILSTFPGGYRYESGTSMAAPFVSAAAALLLGSGLPATVVESRLRSSAFDIGLVGRDNESGVGMVDVVAAASGASPRDTQPNALPTSTSPFLPTPILPPLPEAGTPNLPSLPTLPSSPALPKTPPINNPLTPGQPQVPVPNSPTKTYPSLPTLPKLELPDLAGSYPTKRTFSLMRTELSLNLSRGSRPALMNVTLRTKFTPLAFRVVEISIHGPKGTKRTQVRTDATGRAQIPVTSSAVRVSAAWVGDSVTSSAKTSANVP